MLDSFLIKKSNGKSTLNDIIIEFNNIILLIKMINNNFLFYNIKL